MAERGQAHQALRAGTAEAHTALDARFGAFDLADAEDYARVLTAHAAALIPLETALDAAGMAELLPDWPRRRRAEALAADLAALGHPLPAPLPPPAIDGPAAAWGAAYVVEGSRLGGTLLARSVGAGLPHAYFGTPPPPGAWRMFLEKLDQSLYSNAMQATALRSALDSFALFDRAARSL